MLYVSDFADQAVMLPLACIVLGGLAIVGWWRGAVAWAVSVGGTFAVIGLLKAAFFTLAGTFGSEYALSPSGHVAAACCVYGGLALLVLRGTVPTPALAAPPAACVLVIGYTRLALGVHTVAEVVAGGTIGLAGVAVLFMSMGQRPRGATWGVTAAGGLAVFLLHGLHLPVEQAIQSAVQSL